MVRSGSLQVPREAATDRLRNLGPQSARMLAAAGIATVGKLAELGSVRAYSRVRQVAPAASLNLLWAIEGALTGRSWQNVARNDRLRLLLELEDVESEQRSAQTGSTGET